MGGLVIDIFILAIFRFFRRLYRVREARSWPTTTARLLDWSTRYAEGEYNTPAMIMQIEAKVSYEIDGQPYIRFVRSDGFRKASIDRFFDKLPKPKAIVIRYSPKDPICIRALREDNRENVPFGTRS